MSRTRLALVTIYPARGKTHSKQGGVAAYSKGLCRGIQSESRTDLEVYSEKRGIGDAYFEDGSRVFGCWEKGPIHAIQLMRVLSKRRGFDLVHVQHEYFMYGGGTSTPLFIALLFWVRYVLGKPLVLTMHGVIPPASIDADFLNRVGSRLNHTLARIGLIVSTRAILRLANAIVVHEERFRQILISHYGAKVSKLSVIPHGVSEARGLVESRVAKASLGLENKRVILFMGYVAKYKGVELLFDAFGYLSKGDYILIVAGGPHPRMTPTLGQNDPMHALELKARTIPNEIRFVGYVPDEKLGDYFSAADLVVLPYRYLMSSSGVASLAVSYGKPFLVPHSCLEIALSNNLTFPFDAKSLAEKIEEYFSGNQEEALERIRALKASRSWRNVARAHLSLYFSVVGKDGRS